MSSKNILILNKEAYIQKNEQRLLKLSDAYFFSKHFLIGEGVNRDEVIFSTIFNSFLYEKNCELNILINKKINGELEVLPEDSPINIIKKSQDGGDTYIINNYIENSKWDKEVEW